MCSQEKVITRTDWGSLQTSLTVTPTVGPDGPIVIDSQALQVQQRFDRERISERVVHAKGGAAFGVFYSNTDCLEKYTDMTIFKKGARTPVAARFSTVAGEKGSADTVRDPRGFAIKFYGDDGNWDLVGNNTPVFFIRDPALFPLFIHSQKRGRNGLRSATMRWDFFSQRPEVMMQLIFMYTQRGIPDGFDHMDGFGSHTYIFHKTCPKSGKVKKTAVKFRWISNKGIKGLTAKEGNEIAGRDPDYNIRKLLKSIDQEDYPTWDLSVQLLELPICKDFKWDINDLTKIWPTTEVPEMVVGRMILNKNPVDNFTQVEQLAFDPGNLVRGIGPSNDRMLQMRMLTYRDTQFHRIGPSFMQLGVNRPLVIPEPYNFNINGDMNNQPSDSPVYYPNTLCPYATTVLSREEQPTNLPYPDKFKCAQIGYYDNADSDNYTQPCMLYSTMKHRTRNNLAYNFAADLQGVLNEDEVNSKEVVKNSLCMFGKVNEDLKYRVKCYLKGKKPCEEGPSVLENSGYEFMLP